MIYQPDKNSTVYKDFQELVNIRVNTAMNWLAKHDIEYVWHNWIDGHLYRLYLPDKELLLDFECNPVYTANYNYIRINYNTDIIMLLESLYPKIILDTNNLQCYKLEKKAVNDFLKDNNHSPIYYSDALRIGWVFNNEIYQVIIIKQNKVIANVTKRDCRIKYGTYMLLRYLTEVFEIPKIIIKNRCDNSYTLDMYHLMNLNIIDKQFKTKVWWSKDKTKWHITKDEINDYVPFYLTEMITYFYLGLTDFLI